MYLMLVLIISVSASTASASDFCSNPRSTNDVLTCLDQNHPEVKKTAVDAKLTEGIVSSATQFPNPEIGFDTISGKALGETRGESNLSVSQLIEIGGKRGARTKLGRASAEAVRANSALSVDQARITNLLRLVKYRQIVDEIAVFDEAVSTFEKVNRQFRSRPRLSPDQEVSAGIINLALGDHRHRVATLVSEKKELETYFKQIPELNFEAAIKYLPKRWKKWPSPALFKSGPAQGPRVKLLETNLTKADAVLGLARAKSWPDPTVSFITREDVEGTFSFRSYGFGLSLPLPFWNINGGERAQAVAEKFKAEIDFKTGTKALDLERQHLLTNYQVFVSALEQSPESSDIERKHKHTENLFYRGVISGVLVIEAHRQILDFTKNLNELELETLEALLGLYSFDNKLGDFKYE